MPLVPKILELKLKETIAEAASEAYKEAGNTNGDKYAKELENLNTTNPEKIKKVVSGLNDEQAENFGNTFAEIASGKIAEAITEYIKSATLIAANPQTGPITIS